MNKQLLIEYNSFQPLPQSLTEAKRLANGNMVVSGLVQATDKPNANRRIYPYQTLFVQVQKYIAGPIAENRALGELDHPESSVINLKITVGISSRAMGTVTPIGEGLVQVEDDLDLICWDFVSTPSTYGAYMKPVAGLRESKDYTIAKPSSRVHDLISEIICSQSGVCCIAK
ncbi:MAG: hypothetical protein EBX95_11230 [Acidimicrobiia bacterium]|nr:hypothetical protein [Acidimicrobiia bacterium]